MATDAVLPRDTTRSQQQLLLPFRLWTVRVAVITTGLALVALAIYPRAGTAPLLVFPSSSSFWSATVTQESTGGAVFFTRSALLGSLPVMGSFLPSRLFAQLRELGPAREAADRRSALLAAVAVA